MTIIAHISDTHFDGGGRALARARQTMAFLRGCNLDVILVTGDLADHGTVEEYDEVKAELVADIPVLMLPGNHDDRSAYRKILLDGDGAAPINQLKRAGGLLFALCDSTIPGEDEGLLAPETLDWLEGVLGAAQEPVFVALHHHPIRLNNPLLDGIRLRNPEDLAAVLQASSTPRAVFCGHAHAAAAGTFAGLPLIAAPGIFSTTRLPWTTTDELAWANTFDRDDVPGVVFHVVEGGELTSHFRSIGN
ncbi:phosphodiesterase [Micromonospora orduensis]|uniref:Phosphodiesterase n=1 Tax=Micromonospora orduensis TaxID=1420891 RepID=A0A5C4QV88_9ACTN|nr:metallophosphoesterase [Micromonospora orduensis]TNH29640.1 phosphodiesterase [Micromonospora orduensis]